MATDVKNNEVICGPATVHVAAAHHFVQHLQGWTALLLSSKAKALQFAESKNASSSNPGKAAS